LFYKHVEAQQVYTQKQPEMRFESCIIIGFFVEKKAKETVKAEQQRMHFLEMRFLLKRF
jgi:hypothetical protein